MCRYLLARSLLPTAWKLNQTTLKTDTDTPFEFSVLLVDDDDKFCRQLAGLLRGAGFRIIEANSSSKACALIRGRKASLVLLDWDLQNHSSCPKEPSTGSEVLRT